MTTISIEDLRVKKQVQRLYSLYTKKDYATHIHNQFCMELIHWYDPSISIGFMQGLVQEYGMSAFSTPTLQSVLGDAYKQFRYVYKLYI